MTFDDAIQEIYDLAVLKEGKILEDDTWWNSNSQVVNLLEELRETYAPTVEMTIFDRTNAVGLLDFKRDELTFVVGSSGDGTPLLDTLPKEYFSAWLHPETINIID